MLEVRPYLQRIGYEGPITPVPAVLTALHRAHLLAVPFENLDIHLGRPIVLSVDRFFEKIVRDRRGGFCYELNGLFAALLGELGFSVALLSARVVGPDGTISPPFDHLTLSVECPGSPQRWLCDVGFGEGFLEPLPLIAGTERPQEHGRYRLDADGEEHVLLQGRGSEEPLAALYRFTTEPHELAAFAEMCEHQQTSPESHFTQQRVCSLATPEGRVTLTGSRLIVTRQGERSEAPIEDDPAFRAALSKWFGITVGEAWAR
ncbi:MAG: arylamine N-acetyltransferase [Candidatus Dormibacteraeota bacterium]|nr:arylamine N-acetyltransferase [Candidatus Dormibacteraeota bacterium]